MNNTELEIYKDRRAYPTIYPTANKKTFDVRQVNVVLSEGKSNGIQISMRMEDFNERSPEYILTDVNNYVPITGTVHNRCDEAVAELEGILCLPS